MANEIISYIEMCRREGVSLQRGMNYQLGGNHSAILMSVRPGAPYADRFDDDGSTLIYEGHDLCRSTQCPNPKSLNQPELTPTGQLTENGKFHKAAQDFKDGRRPPGAYGYMKRSNKAFGRIMECFTWWILGESKQMAVALSSSNLLRSKGRKISLFPFLIILEFGE